MGRPRIHPEDATYEEKFGERDHIYATKADTFTPKFLYQFYIVRKHWQGMNPKRMLEILIGILHNLTQLQQIETTFIITKLNRA